MTASARATAASVRACAALPARRAPVPGAGQTTRSVLLRVTAVTLAVLALWMLASLWACSADATTGPSRPAGANLAATLPTSTVAGPAGLQAASRPSVSVAAVPWPGGIRATAQPDEPTAPSEPVVSVNVGTPQKPSESIVILLVLTVLSVAPALLLLCTSFTKIFVVLSITRNALGLTNVPPNQVLAGLALFLSLFIMGPTASAVNEQGIQPYLRGEKSQSQAFDDGVKPLREFMLKQTRPEEIALFTKVSGADKPANADQVPLTTLIPAFALSELRAAMLIGFVLFIPFLVIDMVVSATLMSLGMMMLPPVTVSLPFKLLLFVLANGWGLLVTALVGTYS